MNLIKVTWVIGEPSMVSKSKALWGLGVCWTKVRVLGLSDEPSKIELVANELSKSTKEHSRRKKSSILECFFYNCFFWWIFMSSFLHLRDWFFLPTDMIKRQADAAGTQFITTTFRPELVKVADRVYGVTHKSRVSRVDVITQEEALYFIDRDQSHQNEWKIEEATKYNLLISYLSILWHRRRPHFICSVDWLQWKDSTSQCTCKLM